MEINIWSFSFLLGCAQAAFLALALFLIRSPSARHANPYLALFLFLFFLDLLDGFLWETGYLQHYPQFIGLAIPVVFLYGPVLLAYVTRLVQDKALSNPYLHVLPSILIALLLIPYYQLDNPAKLKIAEQGVEGAQGVVIGVIALVLILSVIQPAIYIVHCLRLLRRHRVNIAQEYSYREKVDLSWLRYLLIATFVLWCFHFINVFLGDVAGIPVERISYLLIVMLIYSMGILGLRQPAIFIQQREAAPVQKGRYEKSPLGEEQLELMAQDLDERVKSEQLYLDSKITLSKLATHLSMSNHYLSQVINSQFKLNFFEYINRLRIDHAKQLIREAPQGVNFLQLAMEAGFNSKSAFYSAFKKYTNMTPNEYKSVAEPTTIQDQI